MRPLIFSNIYVALAAVGLSLQTYAVFEAPPLSLPGHAWGLLGLIFSATLFVYNLDRLVSVSREDAVELTERHRWIRDRRPMLWGLTAFAAMAGATCLLLIRLEVLLGLVPLGILSLAYSLPVVRSRGERLRLKDLPGLKIFLIALVWGAVTVLLPALDAGLDWRSTDVLLAIVERVVFIFAITLPFDIRDLERDRQSGIKTLPMSLGVQKTRWLAVALALVFPMIALVNYGASLGSPAAPIALCGVLTAIAVWLGDEGRGEMYYVGVLDGLMIVQAVMVVGWVI